MDDFYGSSDDFFKAYNRQLYEREDRYYQALYEQKESRGTEPVTVSPPDKGVEAEPCYQNPSAN